jgi:hypothetical protein
MAARQRGKLYYLAGGRPIEKNIPHRPQSVYGV